MQPENFDDGRNNKLGIKEQKYSVYKADKQYGRIAYFIDREVVKTTDIASNNAASYFLCMLV